MTILPPPSTRTLPRVRAGRHANRRSARRAGMVAVGACVIAAAALLASTATSESGRADDAEQAVAVTSSQRDQVAAALREDATTVATLCATAGEVSRALRAAGQCDKAAARLVDPVVALQPATLTPAQLAAIVDRVTAVSGPRPADTQAIVDQVLARTGTGPALTEGDVRAVVTAVLAENPPASSAPTFESLEFTRQGGQCVARVTMRDRDGQPVTTTRPAGDAACPADPVEDPPSSPDPPSSTDPDPTVAPPAPTSEDPAPAPTTDPTTDPTTVPESEPAPDPAPPTTVTPPSGPGEDGQLLGPIDGILGLIG